MQLAFKPEVLKWRSVGKTRPTKKCEMACQDMEEIWNNKTCWLEKNLMGQLSQKLVAWIYFVNVVLF